MVPEADEEVVPTKLPSFFRAIFFLCFCVGVMAVVVFGGMALHHPTQAAASVALSKDIPLNPLKAP